MAGHPPPGSLAAYDQASAALASCPPAVGKLLGKWLGLSPAGVVEVGNELHQMLPGPLYEDAEKVHVGVAAVNALMALAEPIPAEPPLQVFAAAFGPRVAPGSYPNTHGPPGLQLSVYLSL